MGNGCTLKLPWPYSEDRNAARILRHEFVGADPGRAPLPASWSSGNLFPPYSWKHLGKNHQKRIEIIHCSQESFKHVQTIFCIAFAFFFGRFSVCCRLMSVAPSVSDILSFQTMSPRKLLRCLNAIMATRLCNPQMQHDSGHHDAAAPFPRVESCRVWPD